MTRVTPSVESGCTIRVVLIHTVVCFPAYSLRAAFEPLSHPFNPDIIITGEAKEHTLLLDSDLYFAVAITSMSSRVAVIGAGMGSAIMLTDGCDCAHC